MRDRQCSKQIRPVAQSPWALELRAVSTKESGRLIQQLSSAIVGSGGWVLSRGASDGGIVTLLFEFERRGCVDIYANLLASGLELSQHAHLRFTELCQCTNLRLDDCREEVVSVNLEIFTARRTMEQKLSFREVA